MPLLVCPPPPPRPLSLVWLEELQPCPPPVSPMALPGSGGGEGECWLVGPHHLPSPLGHFQAADQSSLASWGSAKTATLVLVWVIVPSHQDPVWQPVKPDKNSQDLRVV